jgi:hypothetical protein
MILPKFQIAPRWNREAGMVEPGRGFAEEAAVIGVMPVQGKHQLPVASSEDSPDAAGVRYVEDGVTSKTDSYHWTLASRSVTVIARWWRRGWVTLGMIFLDRLGPGSSGVMV